MGETFDMKFSQGFVDDLYALMNKCADMDSRNATITLLNDDSYRVEAYIEFKVLRKNVIDSELTKEILKSE